MSSHWCRRVLSLLPLSLLCALPLLHTPVSAAPTDIPSAASFYVPSLPDIRWDPNNPLSIYAGHLNADPDISHASATDVTPHLFFVLVKNRRVADKQRVVFWFNGGPGCSSFDGLMMEVGPWRWDGKHGFDAKEGGWEEYTTMVYVDQPAGTGFSYTSTDKYVHNMDDASKQFLEFLRNFYLVFPEYQHMDTYLAGESFAGQWIPFYADAILNSRLSVPLRGIAVGNGWISPRQHYPSYLDYATRVGILEEGTAPWKEAKKYTDECMAIMDKITDMEPMQVEPCQRLLLDVMKVREKKVNGKDMCVNIYDIRLDDESPACGMNWPPEIRPITEYLGRADVKTALHANARPGTWIECRGDIHRAFNEPKLNSSFTVLPRVLEKIPVLIFAGDQDLICNYVGLENMIGALEWGGTKGLGTVQTQSWNVASAPAGTWVSARNLTYVKIFNASHMAPFDVPHVTHDMMLRFMGVNFSAVAEGTARIGSSVGGVEKPVFLETTLGDKENAAAGKDAEGTGKTPEQDKAMWEAYYNAGSAALVLVLILLAIGIFVWCRVRRKRVLRLPIRQDEDQEESIPLNSSVHRDQDRGRGRDGWEGNGNGESGLESAKGKERARPRSVSAEPPIFDVGGESDDEDYGRR
ncbi:Alpha/Beta hydrolase protein [Crucibulum laeve]|uniref:Pheromone-processing carboxypeptidase KEX1 n=1 Tax=Crucibulum laeve TaxID=68775 RepID=A0A5C3MGX0_9AGAR|nr:Alpha/Beta hydrolase protein [Crucibulum laeve]